MKKFICKFCLIFLVFASPIVVRSAEILQINNSNSLLIGDQNRSLKVVLICSNVDKENENRAIEVLKKAFPRGTKVRVKPFGIKKENLLAKVYNLENNDEMNQLLIDNHLSENICET